MKIWGYDGHRLLMYYHCWYRLGQPIDDAVVDNHNRPTTYVTMAEGDHCFWRGLVLQTPLSELLLQPKSE